MAAIAETPEILPNPKAMKAIRQARRGGGKYYPLSALHALDED
jgi:hypothetical protein